MTHQVKGARRWPVVLMAAGVPLLSVVVSAWAWPHHVGNVGAWLHFGGLLVVAFGLAETRCQLRGRSAWECLLKTLRALFRRKAREPVHVDSDTARSVTRALPLDVRVGAPWSRSDRAMIKWLSEEVEALRHRMDRRLTDVEEARKSGDEKVRVKVLKEAAAREAAVQEVEDQLRRLTIGGLRIEWVGLTWLASGFLATTWPEWVLWLWTLLPLPAP